MIDTLLNRLKNLAEKQPEKEAVILKKECLTYQRLYEKISGMAQVLKQEGIEKGDRVCFAAVSKPEMAAAYLAIQALQAIPVFIDKNGMLENIAMIYAASGAKLLLIDKPMKEYADQCRVISLRKVYQDADNEKCAEKIISCPSEDDIAELLFTTGTTGKPKGVILTYKAVYHILSNTIEGMEISEDGRLLLPLPLNHSFALRVLRAYLYQGATVILQNGFTFAKEIENNIINFNCNALAAVPVSYELIKSQMQDAFVPVLSRLRYIEFSAGSLSVKQRKEITTLLPNVRIYNTWGSSESGGAVFCNVSEAVKISGKEGTLGRPLTQIQVKIVDTQGNTIESSAAHAGRMVIKGDMQMAGYWNEPELTSQTLVDGWLFTGDMAYMDKEGDIFMIGRADDIINVGGEKVSPIEIEEIAGQNEFVRECACIGVEDTDGLTGQMPILFLSVKAGYEEKNLISFLSLRMERYKLPKKYIVIDSIPRNRMQKVDRRQLKELWENQDVLELMNPVMQAILSRRSIRKFTDQDIPQNILEMILKAGYYAPSGHNMQTWRFTVFTKQEDIVRLKEATYEATRETKVHFYGWENPKLMILISNDIRNPCGCQDASCAAENMMLAAASYGIGSVWLNPLMTLRNVEPVRNLLDNFEIPRNHTIWVALALGYPVAEGAFLKKKTEVVKFIL